MTRLPTPRASLLLVALGGALVLSHQVTPADAATTADGSAVVHQSSAAGNVAYRADLPLDDPATVTLQ